MDGFQEVLGGEQSVYTAAFSRGVDPGQGEEFLDDVLDQFLVTKPVLNNPHNQHALQLHEFQDVGRGEHGVHVEYLGVVTGGQRVTLGLVFEVEWGEQLLTFEVVNFHHLLVDPEPTLIVTEYLVHEEQEQNVFNPDNEPRIIVRLRDNEHSEVLASDGHAKCTACVEGLVYDPG